MSRFDSDFRGERLRGVLRLYVARASAPGEPDYAETIAALHAAGIGDDAIKSLLVDHVVELIMAPRTKAGARASRTTMADDDWLRLTARGRDYVQIIYHFFPVSGGGGLHVPPRGPSYDRDKRRLWYQGQVVKDFRGKRRGPQEWILAALQELDWPETMDDPLRRIAGRDPRHYLRKVVARLNARQHGYWQIIFETTSHGEAIKWKVVEKPAGAE